MAETSVRNLVTVIPALASGTIISPTQTVPSNVPDANELGVSIDLLDVDRINPLVSFDFMLEREEPVGSDTWRHICGMHWVGTPELNPDGTNPVPMCTVALVTHDASGPRTKKAWKVRLRIVLPAPLVIGYRMDILADDL